MSKTRTAMLDHALAYAKAGLPVIPLHGVLDDGSCTCGSAGCSSPGKHPRTPKGLKEATTEVKQIKRWWGPNKWPSASIGGVGGSFICLDIDAKNDGLATLDRLVKANVPLPETATVETGEYDGSRGLHYWFKVPDGTNAATRANVRQGVDIRCTGGYAVLPPSEHASGVSYEWLTGSIDSAAECPEWVLDLVPEYVEGDSNWSPDPNFRMSKQVKQFLNGELEVEEGEQREFLVAAARSVLTTGRSVELTSSLLWEGFDGSGGIENSPQRAEDPWTPEDIYALVSDIFVKPPTSPLEKDFSPDEYSFDDVGNAARLVGSFPPDQIMYCGDLGKWFIWNDQSREFSPDDGAFLRIRHGEIAQELAHQAMNARSEGEARALYQWSKASRMSGKVTSAVELAKDKCHVKESDLDKDPYLLAVANGIVDLRSGELREQAPEDLITRRSLAEFDITCESDVWQEFLDQAVPDEDLQLFLQLACGYSLTGSIAEHKFFYIYGRPATGKSTFMSAFSQVAGTYATVADTTSFVRASTRSSGGPTEDLARLAGRRMVVTSEVEEGERMSAALVSQYTGGDEVAARFLHQGTFTYKPKFKLWIAANHRAKVSGPRSGIWRRMMVIPMDQVVEEGERDPRLPSKLREPESQNAILAWAVEGAMKWYKILRQGKELVPPSAVREEGEQYKRESDHLLQFVEEMIKETGSEKDRVPKKDMFEYYIGWCDQEGRDRRVTSHVLSRRLVDMGFKHKMMYQRSGNRPCWYGLKIKGGITLPE